MIKAIIFDCFGVVVGKGFWDVYAAAGGDPIKDAEFIDDILTKASAGMVSSAGFTNLIAEQIGISVEEYRRVVDREERPNLELFNYIKSDLKPKYKIALLSNVNNGVIERKIPQELRELFDVEVLSAEVGFQKPDPKIFKLTIERLGVGYEEAIFTDDQQRYVEPAAELGIKGIVYTDFNTFKSKLEKLL